MSFFEFEASEAVCPSEEEMPKGESTRQVARADSDAEDLEFDGLDALLGYRVRRAYVALHRDYTAAMAGLEITQKQTATLWLINANPGVSQVSVAASLGMDRATMMSLVDRLEERGFVLRKRSTSDRRRQKLYLTPSGQSALKQVKSRIATHERRFTSRFKAAELAALASALRKLAGET
jgi:DNA-binding MarR family transcriptional regulator